MIRSLRNKEISGKNQYEDLCASDMECIVEDYRYRGMSLGAITKKYNLAHGVTRRVLEEQNYV
jgi:hypothetical protein